jgi:hypothetical protein
MRIGDIAYRSPEDLDLGRIERSIRAGEAMEAHEDDPARGVVQEAERLGMGVIVTVDRDGKPQGVVVPAVVSRRIRDHLRIDEPTLVDQLRRMESLPEEVARGFRHEWLSDWRPELFWCEKGSHHTPDDPCPKHP